MPAEKFFIHGRVQGVGFRAWTVEQAERLGLRGWVRNRADGSVEVLAAGPEEARDRLASACQQGPPAAQVSKIDREASDPPENDGFTQRSTL